MTDDIRPATEKDLEWLRTSFDEKAMKAQVKREIEEALTSTPAPRHWRPVQIDEVPRS